MKLMQPSALIWGNKQTAGNLSHATFITGTRKVPRDCIPCIYHLMFFQKIKKRFRLWLTRKNVSTLTPADALGLTISSIDAGIHIIDGPIFNLFNRVHVEDKLRKSPFIHKKKFLVANMNEKGWLFGLFGTTYNKLLMLLGIDGLMPWDAMSALQGSLTPHIIYWIV